MAEDHRSSQDIVSEKTEEAAGNYEELETNTEAQHQCDTDDDVTVKLPAKKRTRPDYVGGSTRSGGGDGGPSVEVIGAVGETRWAADIIILESNSVPSVVAASAPPPPPAVVIVAAPAPPPQAAVVVVADAGGGEEDDGVQQLRWQCPHCEKAYATEKGMFGHLRAHKDRNYKGAFPPPTFNPEGSPEPEQQENVDAPADQESLEVQRERRPLLHIDLNEPLLSEDDE